MWYLTRPLRRSQRFSGVHTRTWRLWPSMTMALVFTKHSLRPMLVMVPLRGASGVGPKAQESSARTRVFFLASFMVAWPFGSFQSAETMRMDLTVVLGTGGAGGSSGMCTFRTFSLVSTMIFSASAGLDGREK